MKLNRTKTMTLGLLAFGVIAVQAEEKEPTKFKFSGEIRERSETADKDFNSDTYSDSFTLLRTRLRATFMPLNNLDVVLELQDSRTYGLEASTVSNEKNLDLHQGYFNWKSINGSKFGLKGGRMELSFANERLIGAVGWSNVGRSFDGGVLSYTAENWNTALFSSQVTEIGASDFGDVHFSGVHFNFQQVEGMTIQPFLYSKMTMLKDPTSTKDKSKLDNLLTAGVYLKYESNGFWAEADGAFQFGSNDVTKTDYSASMFGGNVGWMGGEDWKFGGKAGMDMLSGDDGKDADKVKSFNTLYATGHKFYGYMDYFIAPTDFTAGLRDIFIGAVLKKTAYGFAFDFHNFASVEKIALETAFGNEIDLTGWWQINPNIKFNGGLSMFTPGEIYKATSGKDASLWMHSGLTVTF
ncbi:alginate export family protein [bacterium]|nr:alginate export family protein [bacterium]